MEKNFGKLSTGETACLHTISCGGITASTTNFGATLVSLLCPDRDGKLSDVVLGYDSPEEYRVNDGCLGATVGRSANRIAGARITLEGKTYNLTPNENGNNLHSGPDTYYTRLWQTVAHSEDRVVYRLVSPDGDQGFPGKAEITVTYRLDSQGGLHIVYDGICDRTTIFNMTNHSYFNLAGHDHPEKAMEEILMIPSRHFCPDDAQNIPTGELRKVDGTPMDFRAPKKICQDADADFEPLKLQGGYDHNFEVFCNPCAILSDPESGREMAVSTTCPGVQLYAGNYLDVTGKNGVYYGKHAGIALETQFYPDCNHQPQWAQPTVAAGCPYHSETVYRFSAV